MFFCKKKNKIKLEAYTMIGELIELFPPRKTRESLPNWYNSLPASKESDRQKTIRHCMGFKDLHSEGLILPSWAEYNILVDQNGGTNVTCPLRQEGGNSSSHDLTTQATGAWPGYVNVKLHSPWWFYCSEPVQWLWTQPTWLQQDPQQWTLAPGITEFKSNHQTNVIGLFKIPQETQIIKIKPGDALAHLIPLTDQPWELELKVMTPHDWSSKFARWEHSFDLIYQKTRAILERKK